MSNERPSALTSAKAAAQMRTNELQLCKCAHCQIRGRRACLLAQADAVRECARMVAPHSNDVVVYRMRQLAAGLDTAAKELE